MNGIEHQQLKYASEEFISSINNVKKIKVPIIIEEDIDDINKVRDEIEIVKDYLSE